MPSKQTTHSDTGSRRTSTAHSAAYMLAGQGGVYLINFATTVVLSRRLGPSAYGLFLALITLRDTAAAATSLMVNLAVLRYREDAVEVARVSIGILSALCAVFLAAEGVLFVYFYDLSTSTLGPLLLLSVAHIVGLLYGPYSALLQIRDNYKSIALFSAVSTACASLAAIAASFWHQGIAPLILRELVYSFLAVFLLLRKYGMLLHPSWKFEPMKKVLRLSAELWASRTAEVWIDRRDKVNVGALTSLDGMARYNLAKYLAELTQLLLNPLTTLIYDRFTDTAIAAERKKLATDLFMFSLLIAGLAGAAVIHFAGEALVLLLYGEQWRGTGPILRAFIGYSMLYPLYILVKNVAYAENRASIVVATQALYLGLILLVPAVSQAGKPLLSPAIHLGATAVSIGLLAAVTRSIRIPTAAAAIAASLFVSFASASLSHIWAGAVIFSALAYAAYKWGGLFRRLSGAARPA